jgi:hypothetical protein
MKYVAKVNTFHDGIYFVEGDEVEFPDGYEPSEWFEPVARRKIEASQGEKEEAINKAVQDEIKRLSMQLKFGGGALAKLYEKAGAKSDMEKLEAIKAYMARKQE